MSRCAYSPFVLDSIVAQFLGGTEFHSFSALRDTLNGVEFSRVKHTWNVANIKIADGLLGCGILKQN